MSKKYSKRSSRSRRKPARSFEGCEASVDREAQAVQLSVPIGDLMKDVRRGLESLATTTGLLIMKSLVDDEVERLAGKKGAHGGAALRWGSEESHVVYGGKKLPFPRPRVRSRGGAEATLETMRLFQAPSALEAEAEKQVILGVSMRDYEAAVDGLREGYGIRKSSVSRNWKAVSAAALAEFVEQRVDEHEIVAVMVDGIDFHGTLLIVALGVDLTGGKHILGLWQGATESYEVAKGLLDDLVRRGLDPDKRYLFVLDGSKALTKAVRKTFGANAEIQRCRAHKERNVLEHLTKPHQRAVRMRLRAAWKTTDYREAKRALENLVKYLEGINPSAARSLKEGLEETLTLHRLCAPEEIRRALGTTNFIESAFSMTRKYCRNVKRWREGDMASRWAGTMLIEAQKRFRRMRGHRSMPKFAATLGRVVASGLASA